MKVERRFPDNALDFTEKGDSEAKHGLQYIEIKTSLVRYKRQRIFQVGVYKDLSIRCLRFKCFCGMLQEIFTKEVF